MAGTITHQWNGTVLTITSDSGTSSMDLRGAGGDIGPRGPQGPAGVTIGPDGSVDMSGYATEQYVNDKVAGAIYDAEDGATFTPIVDDEGNLYWVNDKGLDNPEPVNIRGQQGIQGIQGIQGEKGDTGMGLKILDYYESLSALEAAVTSPNVGDGYAVGTAHPYNIYIYGETAGWVNHGELQGVPGYTPVRGTDYWTAADQEQIVADVLAAIGDGDEVSY